MKTSTTRLALATLVAAGLALVGCATEPRAAKLTYETSPPGATLFENGQQIGIAPVMRSYPAGADATAQIRTPVVTAVWPSGAKETFWTFLKSGDDQIATIKRPAKAPNLQVDLDNAQKYAAEEDRRKAAAMRDQARNSARCQAQMKGNSPTVIDDCN
ncbi:MAG TPA: hypothetical protein VIP05_03160 [Burkholderiaceae bacterium]